MKYGQLVIGPAGSGKSTYCATIQNHCQTIGRTVFVVNLDPAAEIFNYECAVDVRSLISVDDVQEDEELILGPNGALVFCMEYLVEHLDWLHEQLNEGEDDYFLFDCPGQIELYSHLPVMRKIVDALKSWDFNICSTFLLDTHFLLDTDKFMAGALTTLSTMVALETPSVSVLSKYDLLSSKDQDLIDAFLDGDVKTILENDPTTSEWKAKHRKLTEAIANVLEDFSLVKFAPLNIEDEETISDVLQMIDNTIQFGENLEVKDRFPEDMDPDEDGTANDFFENV